MDDNIAFLQAQLQQGRISTIPAVMTKIWEVVNDDDSDLGDLVEVIEQDPPLTASVLSIANKDAQSAGRSHSGEIASLSKAAHWIGQMGVLDLATTSIVHKAFEEVAWNKHFNPQAEWEIYQTRAKLNEYISAEYLACSLPFELQQAHLVGMINALPRIVLYQVFTPSFIAASQSSLPFQAALEQELGFGEDLAGQVIQQQMNLPAYLGLGYAHHPEVCPNSEVQDVLYVNQLSQAIIDSYPEPEQHDLLHSSARALGMDPEELEQWIPQFYDRFKELVSNFTHEKTYDQARTS